MTLSTMHSVYCNCSFNNRCFPVTVISDARAALDVVRRAKCPNASYEISEWYYGFVYMYIHNGELSINLERTNCYYKVSVFPEVADMYLIWRQVIRKHMRIIGLEAFNCRAKLDTVHHDAFIVSNGNVIYFNGVRIDSYSPYRIYRYDDKVSRVLITGYGDASMSAFVALSMATNGGSLLY